MPDITITPSMLEEPSFTASLSTPEHSDESTFLLTVGPDGKIRTEKHPDPSAPNCQLDLTILDPPTSYTLHFASGHAITQGSIYSSSPRKTRFRNWEWVDLATYDISREKPSAGQGGAKLDDISETDKSLFSWMVYSSKYDGYITCDDGANEIADFVIVGKEVPTVTVVHIKASGNPEPSGKLAVTLLEVVASQATKNLQRSHIADLLRDLKKNEDKLTWVKSFDAQGKVICKRCPRSDLIHRLAEIPVDTPVDVVIVQPGIDKKSYEAAHSRGDHQAAKGHLVDSILNSARSSVAAQAGDLTVVGSDKAATN